MKTRSPRLAALLGAASILLGADATVAHPEESRGMRDSTGAKTENRGNLERRRAFLEPDDRVRKFQTAAEAFPRRVVFAGRSPSRLRKSPLARTFVPTYEWMGEVRTLEDFKVRTKTTALLILKDDRVLHESYTPGAGPETRFFTFSMAKSITSTLVGMAIEDGYIHGIDDPLTRYLPSLKCGAYEGVTIRHALQMVAGVLFDQPSYDQNDDSIPFTRVHRESVIEQRYRFAEAANSLPRVSAIGEKWVYSTMNTALLGCVVEAAVGERLATYMTRRLWQPAGMEFDAEWYLDGPPEIGREQAGGNFSATLRDWGRIGLLAMHQGWSNQRQLISPAWFRAATVPDREPIQYGSIIPESPLGFGYSWWLLKDVGFMAQGVHGQILFVDPVSKVVIVKFGAWDLPWEVELEKECYAFFDAVVRRLAKENGGH